MNELSVANMMRSIVPITRFNKGEASRIFDEVEASGTKVVMKNNKPACVLVSPQRYEELMEMVSDLLLEEEAQRRMASYDPSETLTEAEMLAHLGLTEADLDDIQVELA